MSYLKRMYADLLDSEVSGHTEEFKRRLNYDPSVVDFCRKDKKCLYDFDNNVFVDFNKTFDGKIISLYDDEDMYNNYMNKISDENVVKTSDYFENDKFDLALGMARKRGSYLEEVHATDGNDAFKVKYAECLKDTLSVVDDLHKDKSLDLAGTRSLNASFSKEISDSTLLFNGKLSKVFPYEAYREFNSNLPRKMDTQGVATSALRQSFIVGHDVAKDMFVETHNISEKAKAFTGRFERSTLFSEQQALEL